MRITSLRQGSANRLFRLEQRPAFILPSASAFVNLPHPACGRGFGSPASLPLRTLLGGTRRLSAPFPSARIHSAWAICSGRKVHVAAIVSSFLGHEKAPPVLLDIRRGSGYNENIEGRCFSG